MQNSAKPVNQNLGMLRIALLLAIYGFVAGCSSPSPKQTAVAQKPKPTVSVIPQGTFESARTAPVQSSVESVDANSATLKRRAQPTPALLDDADAWIYTSSASQAHLMRLGIDPATGTRLWGNLMRSKGILFGRIHTPTELDKITKFGLLVLPQAVVLSEAEKAAIRRWRQRGGSLLTTWEVGTLNPDGTNAGDKFAQRDLGISPIRKSSVPADSNYLLPHTDFQVLHSLPPGTRIWLERSTKQPYLPLQGGRSVASISSWSRNYLFSDTSALVQVQEAKYSGNVQSRLASLGYAEQHWQRMNVEHFSALHGDILDWLLRKPKATLGFWPGTFQHAQMIALMGSAIPDRSSVELAQKLEELEIPATVYVWTDQAANPRASWDLLLGPQREMAIATRPKHSPTNGELPLALRNMHHADAGTPLKAEVVRGFDTSLADGLRTDDKQLTTPRHVLLSLEAAESTLPLRLTIGSVKKENVVGIPVTQAALESYRRQENQQSAFDHYLSDIAKVGQFGGLATVGIEPSQITSNDQQKRLANLLRNAQQRSGWLANASQIASWWESRADTSASLTDQDTATYLTVQTKSPLMHPLGVPVWVTMPTADSQLTIVDMGKGKSPPKIVRVDEFRSVILFEYLPVGKTHWKVEFHRQ